MEENRNKRTLTEMMASQSKKRTSPTLLNKGKQVAENEQLVAPTPPNSPTMEGFQAAMGNSNYESKVEELERTLKSLKAMHATLDNEALRYYFSIRRITHENEWMKDYAETANKVLTEKDDELRGLIRRRKRLEDSLGYWSGPPWTQQNP